MSALNLHNIFNGLKFQISRLLRKPGLSSLQEETDAKSSKSTNPWQEELDRLLVGNTINPDSKVFMELASAGSEKVNHPRKPKRASDATAKDLKAWWSESIATWDPDISKSANSSGQRTRNKGSEHWFN
jgi:hypothetical protein